MAPQDDGHIHVEAAEKRFSTMTWIKTRVAPYLEAEAEATLVKEVVGVLEIQWLVDLEVFTMEEGRAKRGVRQMQI